MAAAALKFRRDRHETWAYCRMKLAHRLYHARAGSATEAMPEWMLLLLRVVRSPDVPRYARLFVTKVCTRRASGLGCTAAHVVSQKG